MQEEKYIHLTRVFLADTRPDDKKRVFKLDINNTPCIPHDQKVFLCDHIHHYESISDYARSELLDVLDELHLFSHNNISG